MGNKHQNDRIKLIFFPSNEGELVRAVDYEKIPRTPGWYFYFAPNGDLVYHGVATTSTLFERLNFEKRDAERIMNLRQKGLPVDKDSGWDQCEDSAGTPIQFSDLRLIIVTADPQHFTPAQINTLEELILRVFGSTGNSQYNTGRSWIGKAG